MAELARSDSPAGTATDVKRVRVDGLQPTRSMPLMCSLSAARRQIGRKESIARNRCMHRTCRFRRSATGGRWPRPRSTRRLTATWRARAPPLGTVRRHCPVQASLEPVKRASPAIGATLRCHWGVHFAELRQEGPPLNDCEVRLPSCGAQVVRLASIRRSPAFTVSLSVTKTRTTMPVICAPVSTQCGVSIIQAAPSHRLTRGFMPR